MCNSMWRASPVVPKISFWQILHLSFPVRGSVSAVAYLNFLPLFIQDSKFKTIALRKLELKIFKSTKIRKQTYVNEFAGDYEDNTPVRMIRHTHRTYMDAPLDDFLNQIKE